MWGVVKGSRSVSHWFVSDHHPRVPLLVSVCGRKHSNDPTGVDVEQLELKHCGDCDRMK